MDFNIFDLFQSIADAQIIPSLNSGSLFPLAPNLGPLDTAQCCEASSLSSRTKVSISCCSTRIPDYSRKPCFPWAMDGVLSTGWCWGTYCSQEGLASLVSSPAPPLLVHPGCWPCLFCPYKEWRRQRFHWFPLSLDTAGAGFRSLSGCHLSSEVPNDVNRAPALQYPLSTFPT